MPANLNPQYHAAEESFKQAKDDRERMKALREMLALIPKHKGTEKLQADIKRKMSQVRDDQESGRSKGPKRFSYHVVKEGAGQIPVCGPPNAGKTALVNTLAKSNFEVAEYFFTTRIFQPAMMPYEDIQVQLIDLPPLSTEHMENWVPSLLKNGDGLLLVFDFSSDDILDEIESSLGILKNHKIAIEENYIGADDDRFVYLKTIVVGNKMDLPQAKNNFSIVKELYEQRFRILTVSAKDGAGIENLKEEIVSLLNIVRIYSKRPGYDPEYDNPFILPRGKTLVDFAQAVHQDFAKNLQYARVWGKNKFDGQRITKDYLLEDKDVIELHV